MRRRLSNIIRLGIKELRSLRTDPVMVALIVWMFTLMIYEVAENAKIEVIDASVAVVDEDRSELSRRISDAFLPPYFKPAAAISATEIDRLMDDGEYIFVIDIPPRFEADVLAGRSPEVQLNVDATAMSLAGNGASYAQSIITNEVETFVNEANGDASPTVNVVIRALFNPNLNSTWFMSVMQIVNNITLMGMLLTGAALIREREHGTIEHLLVMPVTSSDIMMAKVWANGLVIVVAAALSLVFVVEGVLDVPIAGSKPLFVLGAVIYLFSITSLGILLATFAGSMPQFGLLTLPVYIVMNMLSGGVTPRESMPEWLQTVMLVSPSTHYVRFSQAVLYRGADVSIVWLDLVTLIIIGIVFFGIALARFRSTLATMQS